MKKVIEKARRFIQEKYTPFFLVTMHSRYSYYQFCSANDSCIVSFNTFCSLINEIGIEDNEPLYKFIIGMDPDFARKFVHSVTDEPKSIAKAYNIYKRNRGVCKLVIPKDEYALYFNEYNRLLAKGGEV